MRHHLTKVGNPLKNREHILGLLFGTNGATSASDEKQFENKRAETIQYAQNANLDITAYFDAKIFLKIQNNLELM